MSTDPIRPDPAAVTVRALGVELPAPDRPYGPPVKAVRGLDLTAPSGQVTALIGANGAGKTTTLRAIAGAVPWTAGSIEVLGDVQGPAAVPRPEGVATVPDPGAYPEGWTAHDVARLRRRVVPRFSVREFGRRLRGFGVPLDRRVHDLSDGQAALLGVSAALAEDPRLLILDEPLARLDPLARTHLVDVLRDHMVREDRSLLLSTHDLDGMDRFVDHLVLVSEGRTVLEGAVEDLHEEYLVVGMSAGDGSEEARIPLIGRERAGGTDWGLVATDDAASLPPDAQLRRPTFSELATYPLRAAAAAR